MVLVFKLSDGFHVVFRCGQAFWNGSCRGPLITYTSRLIFVLLHNCATKPIWTNSPILQFLSILLPPSLLMIYSCNSWHFCHRTQKPALQYVLFHLWLKWLKRLIKVLESFRSMEWEKHLRLIVDLHISYSCSFLHFYGHIFSTKKVEVGWVEIVTKVTNFAMYV